MADTTRADGLQFRRSRLWPALWGLVAVALVVVGAWFATHPEPLPTSADPVTASTPVGVPVYVGVFATGADSGRTLEISDVEVQSTGEVDLSVTALVCRDGGFNVTTEPDTFCSELVDAAGARLAVGDQLVLQVTGEEPGSAGIERVEVSYRDGLQWATQDAGHPVTVTVIDR